MPSLIILLNIICLFISFGVQGFLFSFVSSFVPILVCELHFYSLFVLVSVYPYFRLCCLIFIPYIRRVFGVNPHPSYNILAFFFNLFTVFFTAPSLLNLIYVKLWAAKWNMEYFFLNLLSYPCICYIGECLLVHSS